LLKTNENIYSLVDIIGFVLAFGFSRNNCLSRYLAVASSIPADRNNFN